MPQVDDPVLIVASDHLHRVGYVVRASPGNVIVQCTAFDGSPLQYPGEARHSIPADDALLLRDLPSRHDAGGVLLEQAGGGGVLAAQLLAARGDGTWTATVGLYRRGRVVGAYQQIDMADWRMPAEIADAIESGR